MSSACRLITATGTESTLTCYTRPCLVAIFGKNLTRYVLLLHSHQVSNVSDDWSIPEDINNNSSSIILLCDCTIVWKPNALFLGKGLLHLRVTSNPLLFAQRILNIKFRGRQQSQNHLRNPFLVRKHRDYQFYLV